MLRIQMDKSNWSLGIYASRGEYPGLPRHVKKAVFAIKYTGLSVHVCLMLVIIYKIKLRSSFSSPHFIV